MDDLHLHGPRAPRSSIANIQRQCKPYETPAPSVVYEQTDNYCWRPSERRDWVFKPGERRTRRPCKRLTVRRCEHVSWNTSPTPDTDTRGMAAALKATP